MKKVLSIDIGPLKTRVCEVEYGKKNPHVYNCITFDTPENAMEDGYIRDKDALAVVMREHLVAAGMKLTEVVFTIASTRIANREVEIPLVKENRIQVVVDAGAQDYFPVDVSEYIISYHILDRINTKEEKKLKLLLLAAPSNLVKNYYSFAQLMNFRIKALDYIGNSAFQVLKRQVLEGVNLFMQINEQTTLINVIDSERLTLQRTIPYGTNSVVEAILENRIYDVDSGKGAMDLLGREKMINANFNLLSQEAAIALEADAENGARTLRDIRAREEITDAMRYLVSNVSRVLDYYNSKFPAQRVQNIYMMGEGAAFAGIDELLGSELGLPVKQIETLNAVVFSKAESWGQTKQADYLCAIGAVIAPIGFISKEIIEKEERKSNITSVMTILILSVAASVIIIGVSTLVLHGAQKEQKQLQARIDELLPIEGIFTEHDNARTQCEETVRMYTATRTVNEQLNELIVLLEGALPAKAVISSMVISGENNLNMNIQTDSKMTAAKLLQQLNRIEHISEISVDTLAETVDDNGLVSVNFAVNCRFDSVLTDEEWLKGVSASGEVTP